MLYDVATLQYLYGANKSASTATAIHAAFQWVLDPDASPERLADVKTGTLEEWRVALPNVMEVTCRKHRDDGAALNRRIRLRVDNGRVIEPPLEEAPPYWQDR